MKVLFKAVTAMAICCLASPSYAAGQMFTALSSDQTVSKLVSRWAAQDHYRIKWDADVDIKIKSVDSLNTLIKKPATLHVALTRLFNGIAEESAAAHERDSVHPETVLYACLFTGETPPVLVVRTRNQPHCNQPLSQAGK